MLVIRIIIIIIIIIITTIIIVIIMIIMITTTVIMILVIVEAVEGLARHSDTCFVLAFAVVTIVNNLALI